MLLRAVFCRARAAPLLTAESRHKQLTLLLPHNTQNAATPTTIKGHALPVDGGISEVQSHGLVRHQHGGAAGASGGTAAAGGKSPQKA